MLILVVDDDPIIIKMISEYFSVKDIGVKGLLNAQSLFEFLEKEIPDLIILDLMLPKTNGLEVCKRLKGDEKFSSVPIIMLSGKDEEIYKVSCLDAGADDYIVKPFSLHELDSRIKVALRRQKQKGKTTKGKPKKIDIGGVMTIDLEGYEVTLDGEKLELTPAEFKILKYLSLKQGQALTRKNILTSLRGKEKAVTERTIDVHIKNLREKLGKAGELIKNVRGVGYKLDAE